jgi:hypothetical protein
MVDMITYLERYQIIKKLTFEEEEKLKRSEEKSVMAGIIPPDIMECLLLCAPGCQSGIEGDGELSAAFGTVSEIEQRS